MRLGTPAVTTRGMREEDMDTIAEAIVIMIRREEANQSNGIAKVSK